VRVLALVAFGELGHEQVGGTLADHVPARTLPRTAHEDLVHEHVPPVGVLGAEHDAGQLVHQGHHGGVQRCQQGLRLRPSGAVRRVAHLDLIVRGALAKTDADSE
jgi:hypothetical protein